jgi:hypothetical protein
MNTPQAVWSGSFTVFGVEIICHLLDNGQRVVEVESIEKLLLGGIAPGEDLGEFDKFARWQAGLDLQ